MTLVTCLFDLAAREAPTTRRTPADYLEAGAFLFGLDQDLVCFADPVLAPEIAARRRAAGLGKRTCVIPLALETLPAHELCDRIDAAQRANPVRNASPVKDTVLYTVLIWSKFELLRRATALDPFGASHLAWIDLGIAARPHPADDVFARPSDRVRVMVMRGFTEHDISDRRDYYSYLRGFISAGYVTGPRDGLLRLCDLFDALASAELADGLAPSEEQLLPVLAVEHSDLFDFHYGDYEGLLCNYVRLRGYAGNLRFQMSDARAEGNFTHGHEIGSRVIESWREGTFECEPEQLAALLDETFIAAWNADGPDRAAPVAALYARLVAELPGFRDVFLRDEVRIRSNFALLPETSRPWPG